MCTIFGYFSEAATTSIAIEALAPTTSRGPDDMRIIKLDEGVIGFQRLIVIHLVSHFQERFFYDVKF